MRGGGPVAAQPVGVAAQLPRHRRRRPAQQRRDGPDGVAAGPAERDLFPLRQRQRPTLQVPASTRSDSSHRSQPPAALFAIAAGCDRGIVNELPSSHARPEHLIDLRNHPIREPHTTPPTRDVAITARTRGPPTAPEDHCVGVKAAWTPSPKAAPLTSPTPKPGRWNAQSLTSGAEWGIAGCSCLQQEGLGGPR